MPRSGVAEDGGAGSRKSCLRRTETVRGSDRSRFSMATTFPPEEHEERYAEARGWNVQLRIWSRKEIENFLLVPDAIARFIEEEAKGSGCSRILSPRRSIASSSRCGEIQSKTPSHPSCMLVTKRAAFRRRTRRHESTSVAYGPTARGDGRLAPGKKMLSGLSAWSQRNFGPGFGPEQIARGLTPARLTAR